jgi:hypothetical protein
VIRFLLRLILRDKPSTGPPSRGDILWGAAKDVLTGRITDLKKWADPKCSTCSGTGYPFTNFPAAGPYERCHCVDDAVQATVINYRQEQAERRAAVQNPQPSQWRPRVDISPLDNEPSEGSSLTPAQSAQLDVEAELWRRLPPEARAAVGEGKLPQCCAHHPCICTVNHWIHQGGFASAPALDTSQYPHWLQHRDWMLSHPVMNYTWGAEQYFGHPIPKDGSY